MLLHVPTALCVCMFAHAGVCPHVHTCVCSAHVHTCACMSAHAGVCTCTHVCTCRCAQVYVLHVYLHVYVHVCTCMCMITYVCTCGGMHVFVCEHTFVQESVCVCVWLTTTDSSVPMSINESGVTKWCYSNPIHPSLLVV